MGRIATAATLRMRYWLRDFRLRCRAASSPPARHVCLVLFGLRTGSSLLISYLNSIPGCAFGEAVLSRGPNGLPPTVVRAAALRHVARSIAALHAPIRGVKLSLAHLDNRGISAGELLDWFPAAKLLILYRRSYARQYLSFMTARATKQWELAEGTRAAVLERPLILERAHFERAFQDERHRYLRLMSDARFVERSALLTYEELAEDPQGTFERWVFPFLGIAPVPIKTNLRKQMSHPPGELVANYAEARLWLEDPAFEQDYSFGRS